jgi:hypothetical protein
MGWKPLVNLVHDSGRVLLDPMEHNEQGRKPFETVAGIFTSPGISKLGGGSVGIGGEAKSEQ